MFLFVIDTYVTCTIYEVIDNWYYVSFNINFESYFTYMTSHTEYICIRVKLYINVIFT